MKRTVVIGGMLVGVVVVVVISVVTLGAPVPPSTPPPGGSGAVDVNGPITVMPDPGAQTMRIDQPTPRSVEYFADVVADSITGWHVVTLTALHPDEPERTISARIVPEYGSTLIAVRFGVEDMMFGPATPDELRRGGMRTGGAPILFPTPNRVRNGAYEFDKVVYPMMVPGDRTPGRSHGIVHDDDSWTFEPPEVTVEGAVLRTTYVVDESNPRFPAYSFPCELHMTFTVTGDGVRVAYRVVNTGDIRLGFGFGLHPNWRILGAREDIMIQVPAHYHMVAEDNIPTGDLEQVPGTPYDLRDPVPLSGLDLDDVYYGMTPTSVVKAIYSNAGIILSQTATEDFGHVVVYTPPGFDSFCLENQTVSTDAHNLFASGYRDRSGLCVLEPGKEAGGHVDYRFARISPVTTSPEPSE